MLYLITIQKFQAWCTCSKCWSASSAGLDTYWCHCVLGFFFFHPQWQVHLPPLGRHHKFRKFMAQPSSPRGKNNKIRQPRPRCCCLHNDITVTARWWTTLMGHSWARWRGCDLEDGGNSLWQAGGHPPMCVTCASVTGPPPSSGELRGAPAKTLFPSSLASRAAQENNKAVSVSTGT